RGGEPRLVQEDQAFRPPPSDARRPPPTSLLDVRAVLLGGAQRLFLNVRPSRRSIRQTVTPETARVSRSRNSAGVKSGCSAARRRSSSARVASCGAGPRGAALGASDPVCRCRCIRRRTKAGLTAKRSAASAVVSPASRASKIRIRRSIARVAISPPEGQADRAQGARRPKINARYENLKPALARRAWPEGCRTTLLTRWIESRACLCFEPSRAASFLIPGLGKPKAQATGKRARNGRRHEVEARQL